MILGNLLDNAVEGVARGGEKRLALTLRQDRGVLYLQVRNGYDGVAIREEGPDGQPVYRSRKPGGGHGLGLESVRATVARYDGQLRIQNDSRTFTVEAVLYLSEQAQPEPEENRACRG